MRKTISFPKREVIFPHFGGVMGPLSPRKMDSKDVESIIRVGCTAVETLDDGSTVELTKENLHTNNNAGGTTPVEVIVSEPTRVSIDRNVASIGVGESIEIAATVLPVTALQEVTAYSQNTFIASVEYNAETRKYVITGNMLGQTLVIFKSALKPQLLSHIVIEVEEAGSGSEETLPDSGKVNNPDTVPTTDQEPAPSADVDGPIQ